MKRFLALDFETSGLDPKRHQPTEIGIALFEEGEVTQTYESLIAPARHYKTGRATREYDAVALSVCGRTLAELEAAPSPAQVCREIAAWSAEHQAGGVLGVMFNATFDWPFLRELSWLGSEYDRAAGGPVAPDLGLPSVWECAFERAKRRLSLPKYSLDSVVEALGLAGRESEAHGALEDAILAGRVWLELRAQREVKVS